MKKGKIYLTTGPMFSGKTTWLVEELNKRKSNEVIAIKYFFDNRYDLENITTHDGKKIKAFPVKSREEILDLLNNNSNIKTVGIDELQFFESSISKLLEKLKSENITVLAAALNVDHNNKVWETTKKVEEIADITKNLVAICAFCGKKNATITNRKGRRNERIVIGGSELYESLCKKDYQKAITLV